MLDPDEATYADVREFGEELLEEIQEEKADCEDLKARFEKYPSELLDDELERAEENLRRIKDVEDRLTRLLEILPESEGYTTVEEKRRLRQFLREHGYLGGSQ